MVHNWPILCQLRDSGGFGWGPDVVLLVLFETKISARWVEPSFIADPLDELSMIDDAAEVSVFGCVSGRDLEFSNIFRAGVVERIAAAISDRRAVSRCSFIAWLKLPLSTFLGWRQFGRSLTQEIDR